MKHTEPKINLELPTAGFVVVRKWSDRPDSKIFCDPEIFPTRIDAENQKAKLLASGWMHVGIRQIDVAPAATEKT